MKLAALGIRMHSGWGVLVAVGGPRDAPEIVERRGIVVVDEQMPGGKQPYHHAQDMELPRAEKFLAHYSLTCQRRAQEAIATAIEEMGSRQHRISRAALLLASERTLPPLPKILAAHPLIHTAEGVLFREVVRRACESLEVTVSGYRERDLALCAQKTFGRRAEDITRGLAIAGKRMGPPWNADHKSAALAACLALYAK